MASSKTLSDSSDDEDDTESMVRDKMRSNATGMTLIQVQFICNKKYWLFAGLDEDILNQFSATSFKYLDQNNPLRKNCIRITLSPWDVLLNFSIIFKKCYQLVWESHHECDHHQLRHPGQLRALSGRGWVRQQVPDTQGHWRCHICLLCCGNDHKNGGEQLLSWSKFSICFRLHWACLDEAVTLQRAGISLTVSLF